MDKVLQLVLFFASYSLFGQVNEESLGDTVRVINGRVSELKSNRVFQESYRLNFDDCNFEFKITNLESEEWSIESFWLNDIDQNQIKVAFNLTHGEWELKLICENRAKKIIGVSEYNNWTTSEISIHSSQRKPLVLLKKSFLHAIQNCKKLDRFKD